jgi:hypothetical protein
MEKLDALVKDTAAKVSSERPKAKTKSKKGPERMSFPGKCTEDVFWNAKRVESIIRQICSAK